MSVVNSKNIKDSTSEQENLKWPEKNLLIDVFTNLMTILKVYVLHEL